MSNIPADLMFTNSHEWVKDEGDETVTIGITDHAQELLGDPEISPWVPLLRDRAAP